MNQGTNVAMELYAVIDTNVIVSALITKRTDSPTRLVLDYLFTGRIIPVYNDEIIEEYQNVLSRPKFKLPKDLIATAVEIIKEVGLPMERKPCNEDMPDPKDIVFYEVALAKESSYLVTGNIKHFPSHPLVVTPSEMIGIIDSNETNGYKR